MKWLCTNIVLSQLYLYTFVYILFTDVCTQWVDLYYILYFLNVCYTVFQNLSVMIHLTSVTLPAHNLVASSFQKHVLCFNTKFYWSFKRQNNAYIYTERIKYITFGEWLWWSLYTTGLTLIPTMGKYLVIIWLLSFQDKCKPARGVHISLLGCSEPVLNCRQVPYTSKRIYKNSYSGYMLKVTN